MNTLKQLHPESRKPLKKAIDRVKNYRDKYESLLKNNEEFRQSISFLKTEKKEKKKD